MRVRWGFGKIESGLGERERECGDVVRVRVRGWAGVCVFYVEKSVEKASHFKKRNFSQWQKHYEITFDWIK